MRMPVFVHVVGDVVCTTHVVAMTVGKVNGELQVVGFAFRIGDLGTIRADVEISGQAVIVPRSRDARFE